LRFRIQTEKDLSNAKLWICSCLILHNLIIDIEKELGLDSSLEEFEKEYIRQANREGSEEDNGPEIDDNLATSPGQAF
jgi:hypothetical protein